MRTKRYDLIRVYIAKGNLQAICCICEKPAVFLAGRYGDTLCEQHAMKRKKHSKGLKLFDLRNNKVRIKSWKYFKSIAPFSG